MTVLLALDAGGTSTRCVVVTPAGECVGYGRDGSGNPVSVGVDAAGRSAAASAAAALDAAGVDPADVEGVTLAAAGVSAQTPLEELCRPLRDLGITASPDFRSDLLATFFAGTYRDTGYALVAGTGAAAIRVEGGEVTATADGLGWLLGDDGSGFWIGRRVVRAALADLDRRGAPTALTAMLLRELGLDGPAPRSRDGRAEALWRSVDALYAMRPVELARFARLAFEAGGDEEADAIVAAAEDALVHTLGAVALPGVRGPVVLGGGTVALHRTLPVRIGAVRGGDGEPPEVRAVTDGVVGAVVLALRDAGTVVDAAVFETVRGTLATLR
ncbi:N-acetylglucosamine kinase [Isoptericola sp. NPDC057559]|uniref:N-acetylglucosamine kinase n=1 Tax=Isoptericola sp. NPDC057559 TaxID=3346168 RepID=UPI003673CCB7